MSSRSPSPPPWRRGSRCAAAVLLPLVLQGCFTMGLWGFFPEEEEDFTGQSETAYAYDPETKWSWSLLALRVLLTPVTFGLDCLTCPIQAFLFGSDDDTGNCHCHHHHH